MKLKCYIRLITVIVRCDHPVHTKQYSKNLNAKYAVKAEISMKTISMKTISFNISVKCSTFFAG